MSAAVSFDPEKTTDFVGHTLRVGRAHRAVLVAKREGRLPYQPPHCEVCGTPGEKSARGRWSITLHHWSYLPEHVLDVTAVCGSCHQRIHRGWIDEPIPNLYADPSVRQAPVLATKTVVHRNVKPEKVAPKRKGLTPFERFGHLKLPSRPPGGTP